MQQKPIIQLAFSLSFQFEPHIFDFLSFFFFLFNLLLFFFRTFFSFIHSFVHSVVGLVWFGLADSFDSYTTYIFGYNVSSVAYNIITFSLKVLFLFYFYDTRSNMIFMAFVAFFSFFSFIFVVRGDTAR